MNNIQEALAESIDRVRGVLNELDNNKEDRDVEKVNIAIKGSNAIAQSAKAYAALELLKFKAENSARRNKFELDNTFVDYN